MTLDFADYTQYLNGFIDELENDYEELLMVEVKTRGTVIERRLKSYLHKKTGIDFIGSAASGLDLPEFNTDIKATSITQPQSSSPYRSITEKLFGVRYNILLFIYELSKEKDLFKILHCSYIPSSKTGCKNGTRILLKLRDDYLDSKITKEYAIKALKGWLFSVEGESGQTVSSTMRRYHTGKLSTEDLITTLDEWIVVEPLDLKPDWETIWQEALDSPPESGMINYSFALQWRLQYNEFTKENTEQGIIKIK